jgi:PAS domain S-box-containing protein
MTYTTGYLTYDITESNLADEILKESVSYLKTIFNFVQTGLIIIDHVSHFIVDVNPAASKLIGLDKDKIVGSICHKFICPAEVGKCPITDLEQIVDNAERVLLNDNDMKVPIIKTVTTISMNGQNYLLESLTDISERKRVEDDLRKAKDELEDRVTEMERFIYTVSHDLRTPLISMSGLLGFLKQDAENGDLEQMNADLRIANETVANMDQRLLETLELSRIGRVVNPPEDVPFEKIVEDALGQTSEKIGSKGCKISFAQNLPVVHVDRMRVAEVLVNLIDNSIRYMGLQVNPEIEIGQRIDGKDRIFFVRDNGIGIDSSQYDKVFELFYKVNKKSEGTGAGLAIVKRIIEVHGGRVWIESELGKGCTVCFTLPLANVG